VKYRLSQVSDDKNNRYFISKPKHILIITRSILVIMKNVSDKFVEKICRENQNIHLTFGNLFPENRVFFR